MLDLVGNLEYRFSRVAALMTFPTDSMHHTTTSAYIADKNVTLDLNIDLSMNLYTRNLFTKNQNDDKFLLLFTIN